MNFARTAVAMAVGAVLALAPGAVGAEKTGADKACMKWLGAYLATGSKDLLLGEAKGRVLWHEPAKKPEKFLPKKMGKLMKGEVYWDSVESKPGPEILECRIFVGMDREVGKQGWLHSVDVYARYDLVKEEGGLRATRVSLILTFENHGKSGSIFERPLVNCDLGSPTGGFVPDRLCGINTIYDTPKHGLGSEVLIMRDITEVLVFTKAGHLASYTLLGMMVQADDGNAPPLGYVEVEDADLGLGKKVLAVREEKITPTGKGKGDCAAYMIEVSLTYHTLSGSSIVEIFSGVVDVFPDAPCASDKQLDKMTDLYVDVEPICKDKGACDLLLHFEQATPKDKLWTELWRYDGKKYKRVKTMKGDY
ncbi:MAG: hypothetical protein JRG91_19705 [Deltaproteobacteria bacterium]|nr:hypothetical protein [Deltaproteobacteria bacterium]